jgi:hypothetical protein
VPDLDDPTLAAALWLAAGVWLMWWGVPVLFTALGGTRYENGGVEDPAALEPDGTDPVYADAFAALVRMGYEPLGPGWMRLTFYGRVWVYRTRVAAFRHRAAGRFAFLHAEPFTPGWHQLFFATCWDDGALDLTAAGAAEGLLDARGFSFAFLPTDDPTALQTFHAGREADRTARGHRRDPDLSLAKLLEATERHSRASTTGPAAALARTELGASLVPLVGLTAVPAVLLGPSHAAGPLVALAVQAWLALVVAGNRRAARRAARDRVAARDAGW